MIENNFIQFKIWFDRFTKDCETVNNEIRKAIDRKTAHTYDVIDNIKLIGESIKLPSGDSLIAQTVALFHDIGRFVQYSKYETYQDTKKDHAQISAIILEKYDLLDQVSNEEKNIILYAVKYHNIYAIPGNLDNRILLFLKLIRDADKLDLFKIHIKYFENKSERHKPILEKYPDTGGYSAKIVKDILSGKCIKISDIKTYNDLKLTYISWIFDINFKYSADRIIRNRYTERLIKVLPDTDDIGKIDVFVKDYLHKDLMFMS